MRKWLTVCALLFAAWQVSAADRLLDPVFSDATNRVVRSDSLLTNTLHPITRLVDIQFYSSSWSLDDFTVSSYNSNKKPSRIFNSFDLYGELLLRQNFGVALRLNRRELDSFSGTLLGIWRSEFDSEARLSGTGGVFLGAGVTLFHADQLSNKPVVIPAFKLQLGGYDTFFLRFEMEGAGIVPWSPGWVVGANNRFLLEGQLRLGRFALWGEAERLTARVASAVPAADVDRISYKAGLAVFAGGGQRLLFYGGSVQRVERYYQQSGGDARSIDRERRTLNLIGFALDGRFKTGKGSFIEYSFGLEAVVYQQLRNLEWDMLLWDCDTPEFGFYWSIRFGG